MDLEVDNLSVLGSVLLKTNGVSAINARDADGNNQNIVHVDPWGTIVQGPGHSRKHRYISYIPSGTEHREIMWHGWNGEMTPGVRENPIGAGGYSKTFLPSGETEFLTGPNAGDGVRLDFGGLSTRTDRRTSLWGMFRAQENTYIDLQFGFIAISGGPQLRLRYVSAASPGVWSATSDDGNGHVSTSQFTDRGDATFRRQFSISWENNYGGGPTDIYFNVANANNEFDQEIVHTALMGSLPDVGVDLFPFLQWRQNGGYPRRLDIDHVWGWFER